MEGTAEVNDTTDIESSKEAPHIKITENDQPPRQLDSRGALETPGPVVSQDTDWHEHLSLLRSSEMILETIAGRNLNCNIGSQAGSRPLHAGLHSSNNPSAMVEELTLKNYKSPKSSLDGSSSSGEKPLVQTRLWPNFMRLVGRPKETAPKECLSLGHKDAEGSVYLPPSGSQMPPPCMQLEPKAFKISEHVSGVGNHIVLSDSRSPHEIQSKVLSASGFQQFFIKSSLKGKSVSCKHGGHDAPDTAIPAQTVERLILDQRIASNSTYKPHKEADNMRLLGGGDGRVVASHHEGISLREWLKPKHQKISKVGRMHIFKQILDIVHASHLQGLALQHLRPSYFLLIPKDQVKYIGSFIPQGQIELLSASVAQDVHHAEHPLKRKKHMEQDEETHGVLKLKHQELADNDSVTYPCKIGFRGKYQGEVDTSKAGNSRCEFMESTQGKEDEAFGIRCTPSSDSISQQSRTELIMLEERWYASLEELNDHISSFSSNIYSLGVLFFELFCSCETWEMLCAAMSDLQHRILPPKFLSESPKEAGFCLWLLHPEPYSRPKSRDIILSNLLSEGRNLSAIDHSYTLTEEEDAEADLVLHFLLSLKEQKVKQAADLVAGLECLRTDLEEVKRRHSIKTHFFLNSKDLSTNFSEISEFHTHEKPIIHAEAITRLSMSNLYEERLMRNINQLEKAYFSMRSRIETYEANSATRSDTDLLKMRDRSVQVQGAAVEMESDHLGTFFEGLCKFARYSKFEVCGGLKNVDILNCANVICSLSFDGDEDYFAAAGVSKKIKIFEFNSLLNEAVDIHYPLIEMSNRSKLSCVCWNSYIKSYLASTDYDGVVQLWDASTGQGFTQFTAHQKRAWSVNFSQVDPAKLASGSDDFSVKLWSINEKNCIDTIKNVANVCCVQFSPFSSHLLSFGSADYRIYCFDMRNTRIPWCTLVGHGKAVSYVKFLDAETLVSASTDNTLKIWDLKKTNASGLSGNSCSLTLSGHTNEKNFVGLSVCDGYIACGSETNEVYTYYRTFPMPMTSHKFGSIDPITAQETSDDGGQFVSSVCWRGKSNMLVAANSTGGIKVLRLV